MLCLVCHLYAKAEASTRMGVFHDFKNHAPADQECEAKEQITENRQRIVPGFHVRPDALSTTHSETLFITDAAINTSLISKPSAITPSICAVETVPKIPSIIEAAALCKMAERERITGGICA